MKKRKRVITRNLSIRDKDGVNIIPIDEKDYERVTSKCKLFVVEYETGQRYEFADEGA